MIVDVHSHIPTHEIEVGSDDVGTDPLIGTGVKLAGSLDDYVSALEAVDRSLGFGIAPRPGAEGPSVVDWGAGWDEELNQNDIAARVAAVNPEKFIPFMSLTELPAQLVTILTSLPIGDVGVLLVIIVAYMFLGMFLESMAMLVLTIPVVIPIAIGLNWDLIWFGIIMVVVLEMGMISPPVGINVFIVKSIAPEVPMGQIFRGIWPFWFAMAVMIALLILFPEIALFLPRTIVGG